MNFLKRYLKDFLAKLLKPVDASSLAWFRIFFGGIMLWSMLGYYFSGRIDRYFLNRKFFFSFPYLDFIAPLPGEGMYVLFQVLAAAAFLIAVGLLYRLAAVTFFLGYTYAFLIDQSNYNNHYYLICLISFLFCCVNANHALSLDRLLWRRLRTGTFPFWNLFIFRFQIFIVYFYGGVVKINGDWLRGEPLRHWLMPFADTPWVGGLITSEPGVYFFSYGGLLFDLFIVFFLVWRKTRIFAIAVSIFFHVSNHFLFHIGIFPWFMIAATVLFLEPERPRKWLEAIKIRSKKPEETAGVAHGETYRRIVFTGLSIYVALQILVPWRHLLYPGYVNWTEEGYHFSWRMKLYHKECKLIFQARDPRTGSAWPIVPQGDIDIKQYSQMCIRPSLIYRYAVRLGNLIEREGGTRPAIRAQAAVSLNFRPFQLLIDPEVDLLEKPLSPIGHAEWLLPLK